MLLLRESDSVGASQNTIILDDQNMDQLLYGLGFGASGGGGGYTIGLSLVKAIKSLIPVENRVLYDVDTAADDEFLVMAGGIGEPSAITPTTIFKFAEYIDVAIAQYEKDHGVKVTGLLPVEAGPVNALLAMYYGWTRSQNDPDFKVYNVDGDGRAVPSLTNLVFGYNDYPIAPVYLAGNKGGKIVGSEIKPAPADAKAAEGAIRDNLAPYGNAAGLLCWGQTGAQLKASKAIIKNRFTSLIILGAGAILNAGNVNNMLQYLIGRPDIDNVYLGTLRDIKSGTLPGYDDGHLLIQTAGSPQIDLDIHYENENMLLLDAQTGVAKATAPSGIGMLFEVNGSLIPYNNGDGLKALGLIGHRMITVVMKQKCLLYSGAIEQSFATVLKSKPFNYTGPITPMDCMP